MANHTQPKFDFIDSVMVCFCLAIVGGMIGTVIGLILGFDKITGIFTAAGFFLTIIIYVIADPGSKPWWEDSTRTW